VVAVTVLVDGASMHEHRVLTKSRPRCRAEAQLISRWSKLRSWWALPLPLALAPPWPFSTPLLFLPWLPLLLPLLLLLLPALPFSALLPAPVFLSVEEPPTEADAVAAAPTVTVLVTVEAAAAGKWEEQ